jgi:hypothetical protein
VGRRVGVGGRGVLVGAGVAVLIWVGTGVGGISVALG